jgi:hypothetical protein
MTVLPGNDDRLWSLIDAVCLGTASDDEQRELEARVLADKQVGGLYIAYCQLDSVLSLELAGQRVGKLAREVIQRNLSHSSHEPILADVVLPTQNRSQQIPNVPRTSFNGSFNYLSSEWPVAYLLATVIVGLGLMIAAMTQVSKLDTFATHDEQTTRQFPIQKPMTKETVLGQITGMVNCVWQETADHKTEIRSLKSLISLGDVLALQSGLLEISYDTGAKVILQGRVTYEVDSTNGGYLSVGKMTGKVTTKAARGLTIRTPTAVITDLGTEFGVAVNNEQLTKAHVFVGSVKVHGRGPASHVGERTLFVGQSVQIDPRTGAIDLAKDCQEFIRKMPDSETATDRGLIAQVDYSETWTANSPTRAGSNCPLMDASSLQLENCYANPLRFWVFSELSAVTTCPADNPPIPWPGYRVPGLKSGFMECSADTQECYFGFEYGLRDDFVVQFDAVQTEDRINITIGDKPAAVLSDGSLSVFFRVPGGPRPEIGLYTPQKGEVDSGTSSGIPVPLRWHNYAVRFNLREKRIGIWVDRQHRGTIDLTTITRGMESGAGGTWASLPWSNRHVTIGAASHKGKTRTWTDNFRVGSPREEIATSEQQPTATLSPQKK